MGYEDIIVLIVIVTVLLLLILGKIVKRRRCKHINPRFTLAGQVCNDCGKTLDKWQN